MSHSEHKINMIKKQLENVRHDKETVASDVRTIRNNIVVNKESL